MAASNQRPTSWYAETYVKRYGFYLIPLQERSKLPIEKDWGNNTLNGNASQYWEDNPQHNIGLALAQSRMCSLDIDCMKSFKLMLDEFGIPSEELESFPTIQGASKGLRVMFRVPEGDYPYQKINWPSRNDPAGQKHRDAMRIAKQLKDAGDAKREARVRAVAKRWANYTVFELRSATDGKQRFDVLPPSVHPDTKQPYRWLVQPPKSGDWPEPPAWLTAIWQAWNDFKPQLVEACPWVTPAPKPVARPPKTRKDNNDKAHEVTDAYKRANPLRAQLERYGYARKGSRYLSPHSGTGLPGVNIIDDATCWIHHGSDPLCSQSSGQPVNSFDLFVYYDHNGDRSAAFKAAADEVGIELRAPAHKESIRQPEQPPAEQDKVDERPPANVEQDDDPRDFIVLGFNESSGYFLPKRTEQVTKFPLGGLRKQHLLQLTSLAWWESMFPTKNGVDWDAAYDAINRWCEDKGVYDTDNQRGRGAWYDAGRSILHLGDRLMINGDRTSLTNYKGNYIYERQPAFENGFDSVPATTEDGEKLARIFDGINWERKEHAMFAMGWVALAPICGALSWRPHVWLTAQRGSGKTWVQENIIDPIVGRMMIYCQGGTTEAGIRQKVQYDARPVMFDEAESENQQAMNRIQHVIELARQSSSDTGAEIMKGTASGQGMSFRMRSMFMMGSINVGLKQAADESRFTVVSINKASKTPEAVTKFRAFEAEVLSTLTDDFCKALRARAYLMIPIIRENAKTLSTAVAMKLGSQRIGDQIGTLLAGYWAMIDDHVLSIDEAKAIVDKVSLEEAKQTEAISDEENCLNRLLQRNVTIEGAHGMIKRTIGELVRSALRVNGVDALSTIADESLPRFGIKCENDHVYISNTHHEIEHSLMNTPWQNGWSRILLRINGAYGGVTPVRFAGSLSRYVVLSKSVFTD